MAIVGVDVVADALFAGESVWVAGLNAAVTSRMDRIVAFMEFAPSNREGTLRRRLGCGSVPRFSARIGLSRTPGPYYDRGRRFFQRSRRGTGTG